MCRWRNAAHVGLFQYLNMPQDGGEFLAQGIDFFFAQAQAGEPGHVLNSFAIDHLFPLLIHQRKLKPLKYSVGCPHLTRTSLTWAAEVHRLTTQTSCPSAAR